MLPFVILQDDSFLVEQMRGNEERYLPVSNVVADVLLPFFEGLESRYQIPKLFLQSHINGELSKEATKVLRCTVIVFSETGKSGSRIVIQFQSKALDVVGQADPELPGKVLSGTFKISHENLVALSKMPPEEIRRIGSKPEDLQHPFTSYSDTRKEFADTDEEPVEPMQETLPLIKITPMHDPDAEIAGLTLTVPSWVSSIERARNNADMNAASTGAKSRLEEALLSLQEKVSEMLSDIREVD